MRLRSDADATAIAAFFDRHRLVTPQTRHLPDKQAHWSSLHPIPCACDCRTKLETVSAYQPLLRIELAELSQSPAARAGHEPLKVPQVIFVPAI
jgi:hypothetical protein